MRVKVECVFADENLWLTQSALAELFGVEVPAISKHLSNIYESGELERAATLSKMETVRQEGSRRARRKLDYYNLGAIKVTVDRSEIVLAQQCRGLPVGIGPAM